MGIKTTQADKWFSLCIRERANWTCEYAGTIFTPPTNGLHCSHYKTRGNWSVRFEPLNAFAHSYGSHAYMEANKEDIFKPWIKEKLGDDYNILLELAQCSDRAREYRKANKGRGKKNALITHYKTEHERMQELRNDGHQGRIEFVGFI